VNYLLFVRMGIMSLRVYDIKSGKWMQTHACARYMIFKTLQNLNNFINITINNDNNNFIISINKVLFNTTARLAIKDLLLKLNI